MKQKFVHGNAHIDARHTKGWLVGSFMKGGLYHPNTEVKFSKHSAGEMKDWSISKSETLTILIKGSMSLIFNPTVFLLTQEGEYVRFGEEYHASMFHEDTLMVTIRWPKKGKK